MTEFLLSIPIIGWILKPLLEKEVSPFVEEVNTENKSKFDMKAELKTLTEYYKENNMYGFGEPTVEDTLKVEIKDSSLDINKIKEYKGKELRKFEFRPQNFQQFVGQTEAKDRAKTIIKKVKRNIRAHFILSAIKGHGKTTFVELLAKELDAHLIERVGKQVDEKNLVDIINEINTSEKENVIFFLDEMDSMDWKVIKILNPIIEQFKVAGKKIKPFIFAGATINKHILVKNNPDTLDRIPTHIKFERYNSTEVGKIITQYQKQLYSQETVPQEVIEIIAKNCKFNPRTSIALLEEYIVEKDINKVLKNSKIINSGLTKTDIDILKALSQSKRAIGANALSQRVGLSEKEYITEYEPFLVKYGYINRTPSRTLSDKGSKFLEDIDK